MDDCTQYLEELATTFYFKILILKYVNISKQLYKLGNWRYCLTNAAKKYNSNQGNAIYGQKFISRYFLGANYEHGGEFQIKE